MRAFYLQTHYYNIDIKWSLKKGTTQNYHEVVDNRICVIKFLFKLKKMENFSRTFFCERSQAFFQFHV
jgi:hypothetical protein